MIDIYKRTLFSMMHWKYALRPILKNVKKERLYYCIRKIVPFMLPLAVILRQACGPVGNRILPIPNYSHLGIPYEMNKEMSILDTFDMYSPQFDKPQTLCQIEWWFKKAGLQNFDVRYGQNGIVGKGIKS